MKIMWMCEVIIAFEYRHPWVTRAQCCSSSDFQIIYICGGVFFKTRRQTDGIFELRELCFLGRE